MFTIGQHWWTLVCVLTLATFFNGASTQQNCVGHCHPGWTYFGGSCYAYSNAPMSWPEAQAACHAQGARLAEISNSRDDAFLRNIAIAKGGTATWLGATDMLHEGAWIWASTGTNLQTTYSNWPSYRPDNYENKQHCLCYWKSDSNRWDDLECSAAVNFICEKLSGC